MRSSDHTPLNCLHVISGDLWAGAEVMAANLIRAQLDDERIAPAAVLLNHGRLADELKALGVPTQVFDESRLSTNAIFRNLKAHCALTRPSIVHTHRQKENVLGSLAARLCGAASIRTVHGWNEFPDLGWKIHKRLFRWLDVLTGKYLQRKIVAVSDELAAKLSARFPQESLCVIGNGVNLSTVRSAALPASELPGLKHARRVGIVARLVSVKRHDRFLAAAEVVAERLGPEVEFYIAGDGPLRESIDTAVAASSARDQIHLLGFRDDILKVTRALDTLVVCSDHEGVPMNVLEAAVLGTAIVSVPLPAIEEIIRSGASGRLSESADAKALATAIVEQIEQEQDSHEELDERWPYSIDKTSEGYLRAYRLALHKPALSS